MLEEVVFCPLSALQKELADRYRAEETEEIRQEAENGWSGNYTEQLRFTVYSFAALENRKTREEAVANQAAYEALQSQINPHFLYNILDTIRGQALIDDADEVAKMVETLSSFFRYSISRTGSMVTLRDELDNVLNYMRIQQYRFQDRFSMEIRISEEDKEAYNCTVPRLILQPVVENAIVHGFKDRYHGGVITIEVQLSEDLLICISDNGSGMSSEELVALNRKIDNGQQYRQESKGKKSGGIALVNVNERLQLLYGKGYGMSIYSLPKEGTKVELLLPRRKEEV